MSKKENLKVSANQVSNLPEIDVLDNTQTNGKVSSKFNIVEFAKVDEGLEKVDKNQLFSVELNSYFCPVKFDASTLEANLSPLVASGILSSDAMQKAIETAKKEFFAQHEQEITEAQNLSFTEVVAKLQENETLYKKVLNACKVAELKESNYIENGKVAIYRANQCQDKEGNNRYNDVTLKKEINGNEFIVSLFVEYREITTSNLLLAIRYYSTKQDAQKKLLNKVSDYYKILDIVKSSIIKAKENNFTKEQISAILEEVFA